MPDADRTRARLRPTLGLGVGEAILGALLVGIAWLSEVPAPARSVLAALGGGLLMLAATAGFSAAALFWSRR